ncbi:hypothetical protein [Pajaroellobacter abortibovis]|uniref:Uncharacterized protein n=1 Tax=Pajaroellobacter abortibovis TaxID=1882918 RepID=A0A1L6MW58_9BACT|nr:hypothetical protein [Pajaroellobacter abortibovis]APR99762.1 hypothetical protein BCY86_03030 [Pajaroellobacter abortibovis]
MTTASTWGEALNCLIPVSHTDSSLVPEEIHQKRGPFQGITERHGFKNYPKEWRRFTLSPQPFAKPFDFSVE